MLLFVSYSGTFGGAERLLVDFATGVDGERAVACPAGPLARVATASGLRVVSLRRRSLAFRGRPVRRALAAAHLAGHAAEIRRLGFSLAPELIVAWGMRSAVACAMVPDLPCPVAFQHNDFLPSGAGALVRWSATRAGAVTVPSRAVAEDLDPCHRLGDRLTVANPGVDTARFPGNQRPALPREVLVLGALAQWKAPDLALEACARARRAHPDLRLRLVGAPLAGDRHGAPLRDRLEERSRRPDLEGAVELVGAVDDPEADLQRATCLLHCAPREPFGIAVLEALAAGRPAVVPWTGGPPEIIDRSCGIVYRPGDSRAAADAIGQLLADPERAARMGEAGRARAQQQFDPAAARTRYAAALAPVRRPRASGRPPADAGSVTVVTVTYNSARVLSRWLDSVAHHLPAAEIIVVDCGSDDESANLAEAHDGAVVVRLAANLGFARACNRGVGQAGRAVTALLNPDIELIDDSVLDMAGEALRRDRPERLLAPLVLNLDGSRQDSVHPAPCSPAGLAHSLLSPALIPGRFGAALAPWRARRPRIVGWAVGCALLARSETLRRLGPFDERAFLYGEDLELGVRARANGVETWFWPYARVFHERAHSTRAAFGGEPFDVLAQARHDAVARALGRRRAALDDAAQAVTFASRIALKRAAGRPTTRERRQLDALGRMRSGRSRPR